MSSKKKTNREHMRAASPANAQEQVANPHRGDNRVRPLTRAVALMIIPFLVTAWVILYLLPQQTGELFAWPITPAMTTRLMGSGYLAGAYFFWRVTAAQRWHTVKNGFLPVSFFASIMALTTGLHWARFTHGHIAFLTWTTLYAVTPVLLLVIWLRNRHSDPLQIEGMDAYVPAPIRWKIALVGAAVTIAALLFYINPDWMVAIWPWTLTPLTARSILGFFILPAVTEIVLALDPRWSAHRIILQGQVIALALILLGAALSWRDFTSSGAWVFIGGLAIILFANLAYYAWMQSRSR